MENAVLEGPIRITDSLIGRSVEIRAQVAPASELRLTLGDSSRIRL